MILPAEAKSDSSNSITPSLHAFKNGIGKRAPLSIDDILQKKREADSAASKPVFLSKEERAKQAIAKRQEEVAKQKTKEVEAAQARHTLHQAAHDATPSYPQVASSKRNYNMNGPPSGPRSQRRDGRDDRNGRNSRSDRDGNKGLPYEESNGRPSLPPLGQNRPLSSQQSRDQAIQNDLKRPANELDVPSEYIAQDYVHAPVIDEAMIKSRYLGAHIDKKRKIRKQSDKKFVFDWDKADDTGLLEEKDPLYKSRFEGGPNTNNTLYGRGRLGGFDVRAQSAPSFEYRMPLDEDDVPLAGPKDLKRIGTTNRSGALDDRHWSEKPVTDMKERDWRIFREDFSIAARGGQIPNPLRSWRESNIPQQILEIIEEIGYKEPSAIQRQAIPIGMQNRDLIGVAETGSGKTAAFLIPMLDYIGRLPPLTDENRHMGPYALVLAPTRELAQQIEAESTKFCTPLGYRCVSIVGGKAVEEQSHALRNGAEIIIATPGRLKDCIERRITVLDQCTYVIMDEADRMVALGFEEVVNTILDALPVSNLKPDTDLAENPEKLKEGVVIGGQRQLYRQTIMFSATMPIAVERIAKKYMRRPAVVTIGVAGQAVDTVEQRVEFILGDDKRKQRLIEILNTDQFAPPIIVFVNQKRAADGLAKDLMRARWRATTLHSDKNQQQREESLKSLRDGESDVLVATDLAGRGIDVTDVSLVVNFQMANSIESYVHRIGRTGRAGKTGVAITFLSNDDAEVMYDLKQEISKSPISKCPPELLKNEFAQTKFTREMRKQQQDQAAA